jgi:hypothetical protein
MPRRGHAFAVCIAVQLMALRPAEAWWEKIEKWSGPGPFHGFHLETRLLCLMEKIDPARDAAVTDLSDARRLKAEKIQSTNIDDWKTVRVAFERALASARVAAGPWASEARPFEPVRQSAAQEGNTLPEIIARVSQLELATEVALIALDSHEPLNRLLPLPGAIVSGCNAHPTDITHKLERRRASIDIGTRFDWTPDDALTDQYAHGKRISFTTLEPAFTFRLLPRGRFDVVDYGVGAGIYWVSSEDFPSFTEGFLEPIRLDFHAPSNASGRVYWLDVVSYRFGLLTFPGGFEPAALNATPGTPRIPRDWVIVQGIYVDLTVLFHHVASANKTHASAGVR